MGWDAMESMLPPAPGVTIEDTTVAGRPARWLVPEGTGGTTVVHLHGGGYVIGSSRSHTPFGTHLAATLGARVLLVEYRLAPEDPAPAAIEDTVAAYKSLLESGIDPNDMVLSGDSAGGGLAVAAMVRLRDELEPLPGAAALLSPWTDATFVYDSFTSKADDDIILSPELMHHWRGLYAGSLPVDDPRLSPALGELQGLPPIHVQVGTRELLLDDARRFADNASRAGVDVTLVECDEMIHIWPVLGAGIVPEAQEALDRIAGFLRR
jgi:acetyl esterase/lipase